MKAMIFAAGLGTRLKPITDTVPKALVEVGGVPMLERVICTLRDAGLGPIVINACYMASKIQDFVHSHDFGVELALSLENETKPLETGGGIKHARSMLDGRFLLHNADILSNADLRLFISQDDGRSLATLMVSNHESDRYLLFDDSMRLVGWMNVKTGEVKSPYPDLNPSDYQRYSFCGIHIVSEEVFPLMVEWPDRFGIVDFYLKVCDTHCIRAVVVNDIQMIDIGSPESLALANQRVDEICRCSAQ